MSYPVLASSGQLTDQALCVIVGKPAQGMETIAGAIDEILTELGASGSQVSQNLLYHTSRLINTTQWPFHFCLLFQTSKRQLLE